MVVKTLRRGEREEKTAERDIGMLYIGRTLGREERR
jgi:hypothetical protein